MSGEINQCNLPYAPLKIVVYDRLEQLEKLITSLLLCPEAKMTDVRIYSDAPANPGHATSVEKVRKYSKSIVGFKSVTLIERETNLGGLENGFLAREDMRKNYPYFIILEDDIEVSSIFLTYMNYMLKKFMQNDRITSISGYNISNFQCAQGSYISKIFNSWGVGVWSHKSLLNDINEISKPHQHMIDQKLKQEIQKTHPKLPNLLKQIDQGKKITDYHATFIMIINDNYQVRPKYSLTRNNGFDGSGERCGVDKRFDTKANEELDLSDFNYEAYEPRLDKLFYTFFHPEKNFLAKTSDFIWWIFLKLKWVLVGK